MRFVVAVFDRDMEVAKMEGETARRPPPLPDLVGRRCSSWRNSFEVQEAVRTLPLAVARAREIHGQNVEGLQLNYARMVSSLGSVDLKCTQLKGKVRG